MINWPQDLVDDIARRRSVLFIGAGISKNSTNEAGARPPDWIEFLTHLANQVTNGATQEVIRNCIARGDLLTACEIAKKALQVDVFRRELLRCFSEPRFRPSQIHENLVAIDSRLVLTTNFDKLYDNAANSILHGDILVKPYWDEDVGDIIRRQNRCIIKVHGTIDSPDSVILTRRDYAEARNKHAAFYRIIDALFMTHTFVFLGASMKDPDISLLMEDYALRHKGARPHYVVMPIGTLSEAESEVLQESMNLRVISYSSEDHHKELFDGILALKDAVEGSRSALLETMDW